jgi:hypothetical protein
LDGAAPAAVIVGLSPATSWRAPPVPRPRGIRPCGCAALLDCIHNTLFIFSFEFWCRRSPSFAKRFPALKLFCISFELTRRVRVAASARACRLGKSEEEAARSIERDGVRLFYFSKTALFSSSAVVLNLRRLGSFTRSSFTDQVSPLHPLRTTSSHAHIRTQHTRTGTITRTHATHMQHRKPPPYDIHDIPFPRPLSPPPPPPPPPPDCMPIVYQVHRRCPRLSF